MVSTTLEADIRPGAIIAREAFIEIATITTVDTTMADDTSNMRRVKESRISIRSLVPVSAGMRSIVDDLT